MPERSRHRLHVEDPALFREAVTFTASQTRFAARLIEKDYFCSVLLEHLAAADSTLVFRGGTCLAKVHAGFYRLSEDLDFLIPTSVAATRSDRSSRTRALKAAVSGSAEALPGLRLVAPLTGANDSRQYTAVFGYETLVGTSAETIKVEVGLREPLLTKPVEGEAHTLLLNPVSGASYLPPLVLRCLARQEAMAEKLRAALSRREVAVRDFYDVDYAVRRLSLRLDDPELTELVRQKLAVPGNSAVDVTKARLAALERQLQAELRPVLRDAAFGEFDLGRAFEAVVALARRLGFEA